MKTAVVVGLFVLVACLQLQANSAEAAKCELERYGFTQRCGDIRGSPHCTGGKVLGYTEEDLSKPFPECCSQAYCHDP